MILVPIQPSSIDIRVGSRFITQMLTHRRFRATPRPLGVLANRVQPNADAHVKLKHFLGCLGHPVVATFRDSPVYSDAIETGQGVVDMLESRAARKETPAWRDLTAWIDAQTVPVSPSVDYVRRAPVAAGPSIKATEFPHGLKAAGTAHGAPVPSYPPCAACVPGNSQGGWCRNPR